MSAGSPATPTQRMTESDPKRAASSDDDPRPASTLAMPPEGVAPMPLFSRFAAFVLDAVAGRFAQPPAARRPFETTGARRLFFRTAHADAPAAPA